MMVSDPYKISKEPIKCLYAPGFAAASPIASMAEVAFDWLWMLGFSLSMGVWSLNQGLPTTLSWFVAFRSGLASRTSIICILGSKIF